MTLKNVPARAIRRIQMLREKKLAQLKRKISNGKYHIPNAEIAKALFMAR